MTDREPNLGAVALQLVYQGMDPPEIATILTAKHCAHGTEITPVQARELYQTEFHDRRVNR